MLIIGPRWSGPWKKLWPSEAKFRNKRERVGILKIGLNFLNKVFKNSYCLSAKYFWGGGVRLR